MHRKGKMMSNRDFKRTARDVEEKPWMCMFMESEMRVRKEGIANIVFMLPRDSQ